MHSGNHQISVNVHGVWKEPVFPNWWSCRESFFHWDMLHHKSVIISWEATEYYLPSVNVTLHSISQKEMWLCPFKVALSWKLWGSWDGKDWVCWRSRSGHITGFKGVCMCVRACVSLPSTANQSMPLNPTLLGFLWLKKVKGEYNDIKTWWLHPGSDHSAPQQLPDRVRLEGGKERETEKTREGEEEREKQRVGRNVWNKGWVLWIWKEHAIKACF